MEGGDLDSCSAMRQIPKEISEELRIAEVEPSLVASEEGTGCLKRIGFEEGIPAVKIRILHFWPGQRHPLRGQCYSPVNLMSSDAHS